MAVFERWRVVRALLVVLALCWPGCDRLFPYERTPVPQVEAGLAPGDGAVRPPPTDAAPPPPDAAPPPADGPPLADAPPPTCAAGSLRCGDACVPGPDCRACAPLRPLICRARNACVASCAACDPATPIACFACDAAQKNPIGSCEADDAAAYCRSGDYRSAYLGGPGEHCDCSNTAVAKCPGAEQVCVPYKPRSTDWCVTCGELTVATDGLPCQGGGSCNATRRPPRCE